MKPIYRKMTERGIVAVFRNEWGRWYGVIEIGTRKSWYRWMTPDGRRFRFAKDAVAYLDGQQLLRCKRERLAREAEEARRLEVAKHRENRRAVDQIQRLHTLAVAWRIHSVHFDDVTVRPLQCRRLIQCNA